MGVVYRARDQEWNRIVALKTLLKIDGEEVFWLKNEFRSLADVIHPNLVTLYELDRQNEHWFFTMQFVDGVSPAETLQGATEDEIRAVFGQLAAGIHALHQRGIVHCDIKPSNVKVTRDRRPLIFDYGLASLLKAYGPDVFNDTPGGGTPGYMSPERLQRAPLTPASDWFAFGVMLYEVVARQRPYKSPTDLVLKRFSPDSLIFPETVSPQLASLIRGLLALRPEDRPTGERVLSILEVPTSASWPVLRHKPQTPIPGRENEIAALEHAWEAAKVGGPVVATIHGPSGAGKSRLVEHFLSRVRSHMDSEPVVLEGRCHPGERTPFKTLDGVVDHAVRFLLSLSRETRRETLPRDAALLANLFPVLTRLPEFSENVPEHLARLDAAEKQSLAFAALEQLFRNISTLRPMVLFIDDLHWGDKDSAYILTRLIDPGGPPTLLLIVSYRSGSGETIPLVAAVEAAAKHTAAGRWLQITLGPIPPEAVKALVRSEIGGIADDLAASISDRITRESGGNPWLIEELLLWTRSRAGESLRTPDSWPTVQQLIEKRAASLDVEARRLLEIACVAGRPLLDRVALEASGDAGAPEKQIVTLRSLNLLTTSELDGERRLEPSHDRLREIVLSSLDPSRKRELHQTLAETLERRAPGAVEALFEHFGEAGNSSKALEYGVRAGDRAVETLAFDHAVKLYRASLDHQPPRGVEADVLEKIGAALTYSGHGAEAAEAFEAGARASAEIGRPRERVLRLRGKSSEQLLRSGRIEEGLTVVRQVLKELGVSVPKSRAGLLATVVAQRVQLKALGLESSSTRQLGEIERLTLEVCWGAGIGFGLVDTFVAVHFACRHHLIARRSGAPELLSRSYAVEAAFVASLGGKSRWEKGRALIAKAEDLARRSGDSYAIAFAALNAASSAYLRMDFSESVDRASEAVRIFRTECRGVAWEVGSAESIRCASLALLGRLGDLSAGVPPLLDEAGRLSDLYSLTNLRLGWIALRWLAEDRPDYALKQAEDAISTWTKLGYHTQHYLYLTAATHIDLYEGRGESAWKRVSGDWPKLTQARFLTLRAVAAELRFLRARAAIAAGMLEEAEKLLRAIGDPEVPAGEAMALSIRAMLSAARGRRDESTDLLSRASLVFDQLGMRLHARAADHTRAAFAGGEDGGLAALGVVEPARMAFTFFPVRPMVAEKAAALRG